MYVNKTCRYFCTVLHSVPKSFSARQNSCTSSPVPLEIDIFFEKSHPTGTARVLYLFHWPIPIPALKVGYLVAHRHVAPRRLQCKTPGPHIPSVNRHDRPSLRVSQ